MSVFTRNLSKRTWRYAENMNKNVVFLMKNMSIQQLWLTHFIEMLLVLEFQLTRTYFGTFSYKAHFRPQISSNATRIIHLNCTTEFIKKENLVFTGLLPLSLWLVDKLKLYPFHFLFNPPHSHFLSSCVHH